jgi:hypothetical protein
MDFKLILIILVLVIGIGFIIKELMSQKEQLKKVNDSIDNGVNNNIKTLKNRINVVASEIKNYNNDLVIQMKKINSINSQMVTSMSNYYTESESDGNKNLIDYLSDAKKTDGEFKIKFSDSKSDTKSPQKSASILSLQKYKVLEDSATSSDNTSIISQLNKLNVIKQNIEEQIINEEQINQDNNDDITSEIEEEEVQEEIIHNEISQEEISQELEEQLQELHEELSVKSSKSSQSSQSIKLDNITIGSSASNKGKKMQLENKSVDTNKIMALTKLNAITSYKKEELDRIAKILSLPTTYSDGNKRKPYNKEELYSKIKDFINNKSK